MPLSPRMKWKLRKYQNSFEEFKDRFRTISKGVLSKQKVCPACRALVSGQENTCPFCGESLSIIHRVGVRRVTTSLLPDINYTMLLLALNFLMFGLSLIASSKLGQGWVGLLQGFPARVLVDLGANYGPLLLYGEYWRLITGAFLHANLVHLLFNMMVLFDVGPAVEEMYGQHRFLCLYLFAAVTGSIASFLWGRGMNLMVGGSGALFGLIGVMIAYGYQHRTALAEQIKSMYLRWAIYGLIFGLIMPGTDNAAHIGGLIGGVIFGLVVSDMPVLTRGAILWWRTLNYLGWLTVAACLLFVAARYGRFL